MPCCLKRARRFAIGPFTAHFEERALLKYLDHPLHKTITHRRCGASFLAIWCGEDRDLDTGSWLATRWALVPLTDDELADMELTPTEVLGNRRQSLVPILRADEWIYCTEGLERGEAVWGRRLAGIDALLGEPISSWPEISLAEPSNLGEARKAV